MGSPPHMRGKGYGRLAYETAPGITPAHAGKRPPMVMSCGLFWDHPRTCGEKLLSIFSIMARLGSPPHMRGKAWRVTFLLQILGITPAHAGKRQQSDDRRAQQRDHPRTCGEKPSVFISTRTRQGSPPHMRGKAGHPRVTGHPRGITPAHAGKRIPRRG